LNDPEDEKPKRRRPRAAWLWSGVAAGPDLSSNRGQVSAAIDRLPRTRSARESLEDHILQLGAEFFRNLHQEEFGPTRADRSAGLKLLATPLTSTLRQLGDSPNAIHEQLNAALATIGGEPEPHEPTPITALSQELAAVDFLGRAIELALIPVPGCGIVGLRHLNRLQQAVEKSKVLIEVIDITSELEILFATVEPGIVALRTEPDKTDSLEAVRIRLTRLQSRIVSVRKTLDRKKGPDKNASLTFFVWQLADLWLEETGEIATSSDSILTEYVGRPQSPAGRFIVAAVEAVRAPDAWFEEHLSMAVSKSAEIMMMRGPGARELAINTALAEYVLSSLRRGGPAKTRAYSLNAWAAFVRLFVEA